MLPSSTDEHGPGTAALLTIPALAAEPGLVHGFSTLALGSMRGPAPGGSPLTAAAAVHGAEVARVDEPAVVVPGRDALVTDRPGLPLLATFADCYPVLLFDPGRRALALAHAGWRGTAVGVARAAVEALRREYGCRPADLVAGVGPGICGRCYEVGE